MTEKEKELLQIIRSSDNPELALVRAVEIIANFLLTRNIVGEATTA